MVQDNLLDLTQLYFSRAQQNSTPWGKETWLQDTWLDPSVQPLPQHCWHWRRHGQRCADVAADYCDDHDFHELLTSLREDLQCFPTIWDGYPEIIILCIQNYTLVATMTMISNNCCYAIGPNIVPPLLTLMPLLNIMAVFITILCWLKGDKMSIYW